MVTWFYNFVHYWIKVLIALVNHRCHKNFFMVLNNLLWRVWTFFMSSTSYISTYLTRINNTYLQWINPHNTSQCFSAELWWAEIYIDIFCSGAISGLGFPKCCGCF